MHFNSDRGGRVIPRAGREGCRQSSRQFRPLKCSRTCAAGTTAADNTELREAKKRIRLLEQENEVLRRAAAYLSQANLPGK